MYNSNKREKGILCKLFGTKVYLCGSWIGCTNFSKKFWRVTVGRKKFSLWEWWGCDMIMQVYLYIVVPQKKMR
ncbi:hypothetical protein HMPREF0239_04115 [Clostridium sp. ATCC BAA-442]|nr:hypothetical protein HMPREF0239_04115 [Clostridium sp. ATCC BAA-442]